MSFLGLFGGSDRNAKKRTQEYADWYAYKDKYYAREEELEAAHEFAKENFEAEVQYNEDNLRFTEKERLEAYRQGVSRQNFEFNTANRVYSKSKEQAYNQKVFNQMAESAAYAEQDLKKKDDLLSVMFDEADTILDYGFNTTGLKVDRSNKLVNADFKEKENETKYIGNIGQYELERRKTRSESQIEAQKAIIEGMKAAGSIRSRGTAGRSSAKAVLGVMAESGALRANIANGLMYAEQGFDLGIAQLKDMLILDQTMVLASRDMANNDYTLKDSKLDADFDVDKIKISATRQSIQQRDAVIRRKIANSRLQADMNAEASIMLEPQRTPALTNPKEFYAEYDNPETEDYVEMLRRPMVQEFPEYVAQPMLDFEDDFHYSRGRENVASSNFGDVLKIGGMVAGAVGGIASIGALGTGSMTASSGFLGITGAGAKTFSTIGAGMTNLSSSFYPSYSR
jgi:hypothetical protein